MNISTIIQVTTAVIPNVNYFNSFAAEVPEFWSRFFSFFLNGFPFSSQDDPKILAMIWNKIFARVLDLVSFQKKYWKNKTDTRPILPIKQARNWIISLLNSRNIPWTTTILGDEKQWRKFDEFHLVILEKKYQQGKIRQILNHDWIGILLYSSDDELELIIWYRWAWYK